MAKWSDLAKGLEYRGKERVANVSIFYSVKQPIEIRLAVDNDGPRDALADSTLVLEQLDKFQLREK